MDAQIAALRGRSARPGDIGEFIAAQVFDIELASTATQAGYDGVFRAGPLAGRTVNVKTYGDAFTGLDMSPHSCGFYLVFSCPTRPPSLGCGPAASGHAVEHAGEQLGQRPVAAGSSRGAVRHHQWRLSTAYLFDAHRLIETLTGRGVRIGIATNIRRAHLDAARIYPGSGGTPPIRLTPSQIALISLFDTPA